MRPLANSIHWPGPVRLWALLLAGHFLSSSAALPALLDPCARRSALAAGAASLALGAIARARGRFRSTRVLGSLEAALGVVAALLAGVALGAEADGAAWPLPVHPVERSVEIEGLVLDTTGADASPGSVLFEVRRARIGDALASCRARVTLRWREDAIPPRWMLPGLWLRLSGTFRSPEDARNFGADAPGRWLERSGLAGTVTVDPRSVLAPPDPPERGADWGALARDRMARLFSAELSPPVAALARGMLLGDRSGIAPAIRDAFRAGGTIHVLSISGLHVCILAGFAALAGTMLRWPLSAAMALEMAVLWSYVLLVGAPASALRSAILWTALRSGTVLGQVVRPFTAWGLAGLVLHLANPSTALDPGFQLSFAAVLGLGASGCLRVGVGNDTHGAARIRAWAAGTASLAAQGLGAEAGTAAIQARMFGALPIVGMGLNLLIVPICSLFMAEAVLFLGAHWVPIPWLAGASAGALEVSGDLLLGVNAWGSGLLRPWITASPPAPIATALGLVALLLAWGRAESTRGGGSRASAARWGAAAMLVAFGAAICAVPVARRHADQPCVMVVIDVGQGDATWIDAGSSALLVDAGPADENRDAGAWAVEPVLRVERSPRPLRAILSHAHLDHYGGLSWLARRGWLGNLVENGSDSGGAWRAPIREGIARAGGRLVVASRDTAFTLDSGATLEIHRVQPTAAALLHENDRSLAATFRACGASVLLAGDLEEGGEAGVQDRLGPVDVLKAPHHGSRTSSGAPWIARLRPSIVTVSSGEGNRFGHPDRRVLGRYLLAGAPVLRTDREGAIRITLTPRGGWVSTRAHPEPVFVAWRHPSTITPSTHFP